MARLDDLKSAKAAVRNQLLQLGISGNVVAASATMSVAAAVQRAGRNVHAVGIGRKISEGGEAGELCVRVYVVQKLPKSLLSPRDLIATSIDGMATDVIEAAPPFAGGRAPAKKAPAKKTRGTGATGASCTSERKKSQRPVIGGISAGHRDISAGTIAALCRSTRPGDDPAVVLALSNNHVFANVNKAMTGDPLYQPGPMDGGVFADHFANLLRYVPIKLGGQQGNRVDCAVGSLLGGMLHETTICSIGTIAGTAQATEGLVVTKHGRTTGLTVGEVDDIDYDGLVGMDHDDSSVVGLFTNQMRIQSTSGAAIGLGGDSGSLVLDGSRRAVGLYFAGPQSGSYGLANHIAHVMSELQIEFL